MSKAVQMGDAANMGSAWLKTEQEELLEGHFSELPKLFKKLSRTNKPDKIHEMLKEIANRLKEAKALVKDFEREARAEGMPPSILGDRKRFLVGELNTYIAQKKEYGGAQKDRQSLLSGAAVQEEEDVQREMVDRGLGGRRGNVDPADDEKGGGMSCTRLMLP
eukprot:gene29073-32279_t